jgi:ketosteroid isomerase-like protein
MGASNIDVVDAAFEAYFSGDLERVVDFAHPDLVVTQPAETPDAETSHGPRGFIEAIDA